MDPWTAGVLKRFDTPEKLASYDGFYTVLVLVMVPPSANAAGPSTPACAV